MEKKERKGINYYKYTTFVLIALLVVFGIFYAFGVYRDNIYKNGFSSGQMNAVGAMLDSINKEGSITFTNGNASLTLVPVQQIQMAREKTILEIMDFIKKEGYVSLYNNNTEVILVEYKQPQAPTNAMSMDAAPVEAQEN